MKPVAELRKTARQHLRDARALYRARRYNGAAYLCGYAVEIALKVRICRSLGWQTFPEKEGVGGRYRSFLQHDLDWLLLLSGRDKKIRESQQLQADWSQVLVWKPEMRYGLPGGVVRNAASVRDMLESAARILDALL